MLTHSFLQIWVTIFEEKALALFYIPLLRSLREQIPWSFEVLQVVVWESSRLRELSEVTGSTEMKKDLR